MERSWVKAAVSTSDGAWLENAVLKTKEMQVGTHIVIRVLALKPKHLTSYRGLR